VSHGRFLRIALDHARAAVAGGGYPIAAIIVNARGDVVGTGLNTVQVTGDPTAHAEVSAIRGAGPYLLAHARSEAVTLYTTCEPCVMCLGAILKAEIAALVWAVGDRRGSATKLLAGGGWLVNNWDALTLHAEPDAEVAREMRELEREWDRQRLVP
jgi:tRNA(adenine34) deaminase